MRVLRLVFPILLAFLLVSTIPAMAYNWWEAAASAGTGAAIGGTVGLFVGGPLGALAGAGIGALAGFIGNSIGQLTASAPTFSTDTSVWTDWATTVYQNLAQQSILVADNEISQANLMKQSQPIFVVAAQKWEQVNYNSLYPPTSPYEFYQMLQQTGFLNYVSQITGGTQSLWLNLQQEINNVNNLTLKHGVSIYYIPNPNASVSVGLGSITTVVIVIGNVSVKYPSSDAQYVSIYKVTSNNPQNYQQVFGNNITLSSGVYVINVNIINNPVTITMNPNNGMALLFQYGYNSYAPINWNGFIEPYAIYISTPYIGYPKTTQIPQLNTSLPYIAEQIAVAMLGAAEAEYQTLKNMGYQSAVQIPANYTLPTIELNIGNFSAYNSSLQAYNLYTAMYARELLQMAQTLQQLQQQGRLQGLQQLVFNATNPLQLYGQYGGFVTNGSIILPNGQTLKGLYLIQPYGGPLTLSSNGGVIGNGGAIAYQLIPMANGTYALGTMYTLPPGTAVQGNVLNPGTLGTYNQPQKADYYNVTSYQPPSSSSSSLLNNIENYLLSHPLVLIVTGLFFLIIVVALIRALL